MSALWSHIVSAAPKWPNKDSFHQVLKYEKDFKLKIY